MTIEEAAKILYGNFAPQGEVCEVCGTRLSVGKRLVMVGTVGLCVECATDITACCKLCGKRQLKRRLDKYDRCMDFCDEQEVARVD